MDSQASEPSDIQTLPFRRDRKLAIPAEEVPAPIPALTPEPTPEPTPVETPCPQCGSRLINPDTLGWCPKCGYCRSLEEGAAKVPLATEQAPRKPSPLGVVEFFQLLVKAPGWLKVLVTGSAVLALASFVADFYLPPDSLVRALWSTSQFGLGLVGLLAAHVWALVVLAPGDDQLSAKDVILFARLSGLMLRRLPQTRKQVWMGAWSISAMACAALLIGGFSYWFQFYKPKKVADKNLLQAISEAAKDKGKDKSLEEALQDFADSQDLTKKKDEEKDKNQPKIDKRPTLHCAVIGYLVEDDETLSGLLVATLRDGKLSYAGIVRRGFTADVATELLRRLETLQRPDPFIPGLEVNAIWVKPEVLCEVHQSGYDDKGNLVDANFKGLLQQQ